MAYNSDITNLEIWANRFGGGYWPVLATVMLGLSTVYMGSYSHELSWEPVNDAATFIAYFLTNPYVGFALGTTFLLTNKFADSFTKKNAHNEDLLELRAEIESAQEDAQNLRSEIFDIHQKHVRTWMKGLFTQLGFNSHARVTIYYESKDSFILLSRYSSNPSLKKTHKQKFQINQGVISKSWSHGEHFDDDSPEFDSNPNEYNSYMRKTYGYSQEQLEKINMKSCTFLGIAISDASEHIGVILFESTQKKAFDKQCLDKIREYCKDFESHLCGFVRDSINYDKTLKIGITQSSEDINASVLTELEEKR